MPQKPLGVALADELGAVQPKPRSKGQIIAGILGDALAAFGGGTPQFARMQMQEREREQDAADWGRRLQMQRASHAPYRWESNDGSLMEMGADGQPRVVYKDPTPKANLDPDVFITLPNGQVYAGPRSGLAAAMTGGAAPTPQRPAIGTRIPLNGGPTVPPSGGFR